MVDYSGRERHRNDGVRSSSCEAPCVKCWERENVRTQGGKGSKRGRAGEGKEAHRRRARAWWSACRARRPGWRSTSARATWAAWPPAARRAAPRTTSSASAPPSRPTGRSAADGPPAPWSTRSTPRAACPPARRTACSSRRSSPAHTRNESVVASAVSTNERSYSARHTPASSPWS